MWACTLNKRNKIQYFAVMLGWAYTGLLTILTVAALFSPDNKIVINFNRFHEIWADLAFFVLSFGLLTWYVFFKMLKERGEDHEENHKKRGS